MGDLDPSNTWFSGHTRVLNPNGISIGSAIFAGLTSDRQIGCIYIRSNAMRPKTYSW